MILSKGALDELSEQNDQVNALESENRFFDTIYVNDKLRLKMELGRFIGFRTGHLQSTKEQTESSIEAGVRLLRDCLTLITRTKDSIEQGFVHEEHHRHVGNSNYGSYSEILKEYRELVPYHDTYLLLKMSDMNTQRDLSGIIAGTLIILERLGVDETELVATFYELASKLELKV